VAVVEEIVVKFRFVPKNDADERPNVDVVTPPLGGAAVAFLLEKLLLESCENRLLVMVVVLVQPSSLQMFMHM